jgi:hypothetical protein
MKDGCAALGVQCADVTPSTDGEQSLAGYVAYQASLPSEHTGSGVACGRAHSSARERVVRRVSGVRVRARAYVYASCVCVRAPACVRMMCGGVGAWGRM